MESVGCSCAGSGLGVCLAGPGEGRARPGEGVLREGWGHLEVPPIFQLKKFSALWGSYWIQDRESWLEGTGGSGHGGRRRDGMGAGHWDGPRKAAETPSFQPQKFWQGWRWQSTPGISLRCSEILAPNVRGGRKMGRPIPGQGTQTSSADLGWGQILGLRLEVRRDCKTNPLACTVVLGGGESQCLLKLGSRKGGGEVILILPGRGLSLGGLGDFSGTAFWSICVCRLNRLMVSKILPRLPLLKSGCRDHWICSPPKDFEFPTRPCPLQSGSWTHFGE